MAVKSLTGKKWYEAKKEMRLMPATLWGKCDCLSGIFGLVWFGFEMPHDSMTFMLFNI